ncbi:hypothetical protein [Enterococcus saccharolyticus]|uniref:hypothetical protein n=1 Tax=Enterococcus saccharolyticus TaxID=41997 RepID=UPI0039E0DA70
MTLPKIEKQIRQGLPQVGVKPYGQIHAHSTGNRSSTAQNEADYHMRRPVESGFFSHVVGNGRVIQTAPVNRGAYDVGGGWNAWGYAHVELIESHKTKEEFLIDYKIYVELLRTLAKEGGIPIKVDSGNTGILSHEYCTYHQPNNHSDHVDPYPYLAKWGISRAQFKKDVEGGLGGVTKPATTTKSKFKVGDKVRVKIALYKDSQGAGRSTKSVGKIGTIKRDVGKGKRFLIENWGWAHENDIELVVDNTYTAKKVGDTVTVQNFATHYQTGEKISPWVKGSKHKIKDIKPVNQSKSKRAYLLDKINSWVLEQDVK